MTSVRPIADSGARSPAPLSSLRARHQATTTNPSAATNAGSRPPVNSAAIDRPGVTEPIVISTRLGGIVSDIALDVASNDDNSPGWAPRFCISGKRIGATAAMSAVAPILFPEMQKRGAHPGELSSLLATSSAMSETIPPSLVLITMGSVVPGLSIAALFTGGLLPAFVAALGLVVVAWWRARKEDKGAGERAPLSAIGRTLVIALPGLSLPFVIRYTVIKGVATATEVSTIGVVYTAMLGILVYRQFDWRRIYPILVETVSLTGAVMMIIGTATGMAWALTQSGFSLWLVSAMEAVPGGRWGFQIGRAH